MDANRYFDAMHNAMSAQHPGAQLLLTVKLQDTCGNDACLELKQLPGESTSILCYSTMGRRYLNFQLFRKGWQLCHNADGQLVGRFPSSADGLIDETDFRAYCREDRLDLARTQRITAELRQCAGIDYQGSIPQNARTGAVITVESFVGAGARWTYWSQDVLPSLWASSQTALIISGFIFSSPGVPFSVASSTPPVIISLTRSTFWPLAFLS